ncbi:MAG: hypothetical protein HOI00_08275 [Halieaceae bacterium]|nr:hypothetical protein [Halieaceae bacterium]
MRLSVHKVGVSSNAYESDGVYDAVCRVKALFNFPQVRFLLALQLSSNGSGLNMDDRRQSDRRKEERRKEQERRQAPRETPDRREEERRKGERRSE